LKKGEKYQLDKIFEEKRRIYKKYLKTKKLTKKEIEFCDKIDWHPVDDLPLTKEFKEELKKLRKGKFHKFKSIEELKKCIEEDKD